MRKFKVRENLMPYIEKILERRGIDYLHREDNTLLVDLSGNQFHKVVTRAKCEALNDKENLDERHTYYVSKTEPQYKLMAENPEWEYFIEFPYEGFQKVE